MGVFVYDLCFAGCGCTSASGEYLLFKSLKELLKNVPLTFVLKIFSTALHKKNTLGRKKKKSFPPGISLVEGG